MLSLFFILMNLSSVFADSMTDELMSAKDIGEIKRVIGKNETQSLYLERCRAELQGPYLPTHCYLWLGKKVIPRSEKSVLLNTFDTACEQRLAQGITVGDRNLKFMDQFSGKCQKALKSWLKVKLYKLHREDAAQLLKQVESGRVFESVLSHANTKSVSQNRVHPSRATGVRLN